jgi:hypothetical protein
MTSNSNRIAHILNRARATCERLRAVEDPRPPGVRADHLEALVMRDPIERWKLDSDRRTAAREAAKAEIAAAKPAPPFDWSAFDARCQLLIERERVLLAEAFGTEVAKLIAAEREDTMREVREEMRELRLEAAKLGSEAAELRAQLAVDRGKVIDMPRVPLRNVN